LSSFILSYFFTFVLYFFSFRLLLFLSFHQTSSSATNEYFELHRIITFYTQNITDFSYPPSQGDDVIQKGTDGNVFYMIKEGKVRVTNISDGMTYFDHDLGPGEYFGERSLLTGEPRAANIRAVSNVVLMALDRLSFDALLGPLKDVLNQNMILRVLNSQKFFENVDYNTKTKLAKTFVLELFLAGVFLFIYFFMRVSIFFFTFILLFLPFTFPLAVTFQMNFHNFFYSSVPLDLIAHLLIIT
jgi:Cyclic nucleotide-binding domain